MIECTLVKYKTSVKKKLVFYPRYNRVQLNLLTNIVAHIHILMHTHITLSIICIFLKTYVYWHIYTRVQTQTYTYTYSHSYVRRHSRTFKAQTCHIRIHADSHVRKLLYTYIEYVQLCYLNTHLNMFILCKFTCLFTH